SIQLTSRSVLSRGFLPTMTVSDGFGISSTSSLTGSALLMCTSKVNIGNQAAGVSGQSLHMRANRRDPRLLLYRSEAGLQMWLLVTPRGLNGSRCEGLADRGGFHRHRVRHAAGPARAA